tara:strand:- start:309 stop:1061 length:753 start_codon:yes stop_codon:yes gene_type:complete
MNKNLYLNCFFIFFSISCLSASNIILNPSYQFDYLSTDIDASSDSIGSFNGTILNISSDVITLAVIRRVNDLSEGWTSSICAGVTCYDESVDSISIQINSGDSVSCGVLAWTNGSGNGIVQLDIFDLSSPTENILVDINFYFQTTISVIFDDNKSDLSNKFILNNNYPNPFNPQTKISYYLYKDGIVNIYIYDSNGNRIIDHALGMQPAGHCFFLWSADDNRGQKLVSGVYFYTLEVEGERRTKSMVLLK